MLNLVDKSVSPRRIHVKYHKELIQAILEHFDSCAKLVVCGIRYIAVIFVYSVIMSKNIVVVLVVLENVGLLKC